jgi:hypothetical protein
MGMKQDSGAFISPTRLLRLTVFPFLAVMPCVLCTADQCSDCSHFCICIRLAPLVIMTHCSARYSPLDSTAYMRMDPNI